MGLDMAASTMTLDLLGLPEDTIFCILNKLTFDNLITVGFVCKSLFCFSSADCLWMNLCNCLQGDVNLGEWRGHLNSGKAMFRLLRSFQKLSGVWRAKELYPRGGILYISWGNLRLIASRVWTCPADDVILKPVFEVIGLPDGSVRSQLFTGDVDFKVPVKLLWSTKEEPEFEFQLCESSEASPLINPIDRENEDQSCSDISSKPTNLLKTKHLANIVKLLGPDHIRLGDDEEFLDGDANLTHEQLLHPANETAANRDQESASNPQQLRRGHIGHQAIEYLRSMYTFGRQTAGTRIFSSTKKINKSSYTKLKVDEPKPGRELAGLWSGIYGPHGLEIVNVSYTDDEIVATKLIGDPNVPCSEVTFKVTLSSVTMDAHMDLRWILTHGDGDAFKISRMYRGSGRIAGHGFHNPKWVPGRLLVQQNGNMAFLWEDVNFVITFHRLHLKSLTLDVEQNRLP
uniref:F-box domain-containing protein n=1 Tax=Araucaria cunninghamii TaxID=56994 RepID=A0A0D6QUW6_ARACU